MCHWPILLFVNSLVARFAHYRSIGIDGSRQTVQTNQSYLGIHCLTFHAASS